MPERRALDFDRIDAIMPDVDRLLNGHATAGQWTLGQILDHLAKTIRLTTRASHGEGLPTPPTPEQDAARRDFFRARTISTGRQVPTRLLLPDADANPHVAAESLRAALDRLYPYEGPFPTHPFLGPLNRDEWLQFHCIHCAHHLSFALPA